MTFYMSSSLTPTHFSKPLNPSNTLFPIQFRGSLSSFVRRRKPTEAKLSSKFNLFPSRRNGLITCCSTSSFESTESSVSQEEDAESNRLFERLREAERERLSNMEELERKANVQLERQLVMASD